MITTTTTTCNVNLVYGLFDYYLQLLLQEPHHDYEYVTNPRLVPYTHARPGTTAAVPGTTTTEEEEEEVGLFEFASPHHSATERARFAHEIIRSFLAPLSDSHRRNNSRRSQQAHTRTPVDTTIHK